MKCIKKVLIVDIFTMFSFCRTECCKELHNESKSQIDSVESPISINRTMFSNNKKYFELTYPKTNNASTPHMIKQYSVDSLFQKAEQYSNRNSYNTYQSSRKDTVKHLTEKFLSACKCPTQDNPGLNGIPIECALKVTKDSRRLYRGFIQLCKSKKKIIFFSILDPLIDERRDKRVRDLKRELIILRNAGDQAGYEAAKQYLESVIIEYARVREEEQHQEEHISQSLFEVPDKCMGYDLNHHQELLRSLSITSTHRNEISLKEVKSVLIGDDLEKVIPHISEKEKRLGICFIPLPEKTAPLLLIARDEKECDMISVALQVLVMTAQSHSIQ